MQATKGDNENKGEGGHGSGGWRRRWSPPTTPLPSYVIDAIQAVYSPSIKTEEIPSSSSSNDTIYLIRFDLIPCGLLPFFTINSQYAFFLRFTLLIFSASSYCT